jgi:predicted alpha/beta hydrolase
MLASSANTAAPMNAMQQTFTTLRVCVSDGASADLRLVHPEQPTRALYLLPALGVGIRPNEVFAAALAERGVAVAIHEWRGLGSSSVRAARDRDWGYRELLEGDIPAGLQAARSALPGLQWSIAGHSLGGQLALLSAALQPKLFQRVHLVASGLPDWRSYPRLHGLGIWAALHLLPATAVALGHYPGERLGFAGREARGLMRDWAHSGRQGRYRLRGSSFDPEAALTEFHGDVQGLHLASDWLCPRASLEQLARKSPRAKWRIDTLHDADFAPRRADHFGWLKQPQAVVEHLLTSYASSPAGT